MYNETLQLSVCSEIKLSSTQMVETFVFTVTIEGVVSQSLVAIVTVTLRNHPFAHYKVVVDQPIAFVNQDTSSVTVTNLNFAIAHLARYCRALVGFMGTT